MSVDQLVKQQQHNQKTLKEIQGTLAGMLKADKKRDMQANLVKRREKVSARIAKQDKEKKKGVVQTMKDSAKAGQSFLDGIIKNITNMALGAALVGVIGYAIFKVFQNEKLRNRIFTLMKDAVVAVFTNEKVKGAIDGLVTGALDIIAEKLPGMLATMFDKAFAPIRQWLTTWAPVWLPNENKPVGGTGVTPRTAEEMKSQASKDLLAANEKGDKAALLAARQKLEQLDQLIQTQQKYLELSASLARRQTAAAEQAAKTQELAAEIAALDAAGKFVNPLDRVRLSNAKDADEIQKILLGTGQAKLDALEKKMDAIIELDWFKEAAAAATQKASGGPITVPGTGVGDKVLSFIQPGSFVMNKKAFQGLMEGGIPAMLEPGEGVFAPGSWGPMEMMMNQAMPRFQQGGVFHPHTGTGWSVGSDNKGRPAVMSEAAAKAFMKMMKDSGGIVKPSDIYSAQRSHDHNRRVGGVPGSNHLTGNAVDIHGASKSWMKEHGPKYGFHNLNYSGHDGHFDYKGAGTGAAIVEPKGEGKEETAETDNSKGTFTEVLQSVGQDMGKLSGFLSTAGEGVQAGLAGMGLPGLGEAMGIFGAKLQQYLGPIIGGAAKMIAGGLDGGLNFMEQLVGGMLGGNTGGGNTPGGGNDTSSGPQKPDPASAGSMSHKQVIKAAMAAGFSEKQARIVSAIATGESGRDPTNSTRRSGLYAQTGEDSVGLMQINWGYHKDSGWLQKLGITKREQLFDPATNLKAAKYLHDGSGGFSDWTVYTKGIYQGYMDAANSAKLQKGGVANFTTSRSRTMQRFAESTQLFEKMVANTNQPIIVPVPTGGGGGGGGQAAPFGQGGPPQTPHLSAQTSVVALLELQQRLAMGANV